MKVRVIKRFHDLAEKKIQEVKIKKDGKEVDNILEVSEARAKHLVKQKMVEIINEDEKTSKTGKGKIETAEGKEQ